MKIAFVTQDQLNAVWHMLHPQDRMFLGEGLSGAAIRLTDTMLVVGAEEIKFEQVLEEVERANTEAQRIVREYRARTCPQSKLVP